MSDDLSTETFHEPAASLKPGTIINEKYELLEQIGRGGMGVVWEANDRISDRLVALKFVPNEIKRFEVEMQRVRETFKRVHALQHHSICPVYMLEDGGHLGYYLVMKYLEGETLDAYVLRKATQSGTLPLDQVIAILSRAAVALDYAHQNGVIHRDIKPSNIFLAKGAGKLHVQIIDFGLADEIRTSMTRTSQVQIEVSGTRPYMAPEQWRGRTQSAATDQYALAVVAYELLAGQLPFKGSDVALLRLAVMNDLPEPIAAISDSANMVLQKALAKNAADRFRTCRDFIAALGGAWTTVETITPEDDDEDDEEATPFTLSDVPRWAWTLAGCVLSALVLGVLVWGISGNKTVPPSAETSTVAPAQERGANAAPLATQQTPQPQLPPPANIFEAAARGTVNEVRHFIERGGNVTQRDERGWTPLHHAAERNPDVEVLKYLLSQQGADVNERRPDGTMPLHGAAWGNSNLEVVKLLVSRGADVHAKNNGGDTPLHSTARKNPNQEITKFLIASGADVNAKNNDGRTPLGEANTVEKIDILRAAGAAFSDIFDAVWNGTVQDVASFIERGVDVNAGVPQGYWIGYTPLHMASLYGTGKDNLEIIKYLIAQGADVNHRNNRFTNTPLQGAAADNQVEKAKYLVAQGADVNAKNNGGDTPLHHAVMIRANNVEVIQYLVSQGADVLAKRDGGNTPLHDAAQHHTNNDEVLKYLVTISGADRLNIKNAAGRTPLDVANTEAKKAIIRAAGGKSGSEL